MNEKVSEIVTRCQNLLSVLIEESSANLENWDRYQRSRGYVKRIMSASTEDFGYLTYRLVQILSKIYAPFKDEKIRLDWFSCGYNVRTHGGILVPDGIDVWCLNDIPQSEISEHLRNFRTELPRIFANLFGPEIWRKGSIADLPPVFQNSHGNSIEYNVFYKDARKCRSTGSIYIAKLTHEKSVIYDLLIFYGIILRLIIFGWGNDMPHTYIYDKRLGFIFDKKREAEARSVLGLQSTATQ